MRSSVVTSIVCLCMIVLAWTGSAQANYESGIEEQWASFDGYTWRAGGSAYLFGEHRQLEGAFWFDHDWTDGLSYADFVSGDFSPISELRVGFGDNPLVHSGQPLQYVQQEPGNRDTEVFFTGGVLGQQWFGLRFYAINNTDIIIESDRHKIADGGMETDGYFDRFGNFHRNHGVWDSVEFMWTDSSGLVQSTPVYQVDKPFLTSTANTPPDLVEATINGINSDLVLDEKRGSYTLTLQAAATDAQGGVLEFIIDGDGPFQATNTAPGGRRLSQTVTRTISAADTGDSPHELLFRVTDPTFGYANWTRTVTIRNLAPQVEPIELVYENGDRIAPGETITFSVLASDPGGDPMTYAWDLDGDGQYDDHLGRLGSMTFDNPLLSQIGVKVTDDAGAFTRQQIHLAVVPEPATAIGIMLIGTALGARRRLLSHGQRRSGSGAGR